MIYLIVSYLSLQTGNDDYGGYVSNQSLESISNVHDDHEQ